MSEIAPTLIALPILAIISIIDIRERRIPNKITFPSLVCFVSLFYLVARYSNDMPGFSRAMLGLALSFLFFVSLHAVYPKGIGLGDVKFSALIGLLLGWNSFDSIFYGIAAIFISAAIFSVALIVRNSDNLKSSVPFAPFMSLGYLFGAILF
jgi:leader peptidase (prepilin peptidase)/N-methyltransferase